MNSGWRIIFSGSGSAAYNMALDEALLQSFDQLSRPLIRFYSWSHPALSLGRFQDALQIVRREQSRQDSLPVVRRITGGGALYHDDELTYSIVCSAHHLPPSCSIKETYCQLTGFLLAWYQNQGLDACYARDLLPVPALGERTAYCFAGKESFDIMVAGKKMGGNAQRRTRNLIFQHGSIPRTDSAATGLSYLQPECRGDGLFATTSLVECGITVDIDSIAVQLADMFCRLHDATGTVSPLTDQEMQLADRLMNTKYASDQWNFHGLEQ